MRSGSSMSVVTSPSSLGASMVTVDNGLARPHLDVADQLVAPVVALQNSLEQPIPVLERQAVAVHEPRRRARTRVRRESSM